MLVDDHRHIRQNLRSIVTQQSHWQVYDVDNGTLALDLIPQIQPHVVVLDLIMPDMNGVELASEIRRLEHAPQIVLVSSHYTSNEVAHLARLFGDGNFVPKSEAAKLLVPTIARLLPEECQANGTTA